jgi:hypothetical protein
MMTVFMYYCVYIQYRQKEYRSSRLAAIFVKRLMTQGFLLDDEKMRDRVFSTIA